MGTPSVLAHAKTNWYNKNNTLAQDDYLACGLILEIITYERISSPPTAGNDDTLYVLWPRKTKNGWEGGG